MHVDGGHRQKGYWFSARSLSKWPPGGHIGFFWFPDSNFSLALNINSKLKWHNTYVLGAYWFSAMLILKWPPGSHIGIFGFRTLTLVWLWISTANLSGTILIYMGRSLLIFRDVTFKMAAWRPYWIFWFPERLSAMSLSKWLPCDFEQCHPLLWGGGILVDHWSIISS